MAYIIQLRRDIAANFTAKNPILAEGEPAIELDTLKEKIGNGVSAWNDLPYKSINSTDSLYLGYYVDGAALIAAHPTALNGNYAVVGATDTVWIWDVDTPSWVDSGNPQGLIPLNSVGVAELKEELKGYIDLGNVSGTLTIDYSSKIGFKFNMVGNTTLAFTNVIGGKSIELIYNPQTYVLTHPAGFVTAQLSGFTASLTNYETIYCPDATVPIFKASIDAR